MGVQQTQFTTNYFDCTGNIGAHSTSLPTRYYMITAGHCSPATTTWYNGYACFCNGQTISLNGSLTPIGAASSNLFGAPPNIDVADLATTQTSSLVWVGSSTNASLYNVAGITKDVAGATACPDGAFEGWTCTSTIQATGYDGCINVNDSGIIYTTCNTIEAAAPSGSPVVGQGDSGGPVLSTIQGPGVSVNGILTAEQGPGINCPAYTWRGPVCASTWWYTDMGSALNALGLVAN